MAERKFFRLGDRVTVFNWMLADGIPVEGRVVCTNRISKYDESVVVLSLVHDSENILAFKADGTRFLQGNSCRIELGFKP